MICTSLQSVFFFCFLRFHAKSPNYSAFGVCKNRHVHVRTEAIGFSLKHGFTEKNQEILAFFSSSAPLNLLAKAKILEGLQMCYNFSASKGVEKVGRFFHKEVVILKRE